MKKLDVSIDINGRQILAGKICGESWKEAVFTYSEEYIESGLPPISISLPVTGRIFTPEKTQCFFDGLLPEGFARKSVADWIHAPEDDYLTILEALGSECLGAIRISSGDRGNKIEGGYEKLSMEEVRLLAREGISKSTELVTGAHLSLTGASGKAGLYYDPENNRWFMPKGDAPSTHIIKQSHIRLPEIVANEKLSLSSAERLGIDVPESFIINTGSGEDRDVLFATKRYDRLINSKSEIMNGLRTPFRLHQEDFAQAMGIASADKYERENQQYLSGIFHVLRSHVQDPIADQIKLWNILIYDFLIGNTDNHIKNLSLLYSEDLRKKKLAPAYDIVSTVVYQSTSRDMAIGIGGERNIDRITRSSFAGAAEEAGLSTKLAIRNFDNMADRFENVLMEQAAALCEEGYKDAKKIADSILKSGGYSHI